MPSRSRLNLVGLPGFTGGLNTSVPKSTLGLDEVPYAVDVDFGLRGEVSKRRGVRQLYDPATDHFHHLYYFPSESLWIAVADTSGDIYYSSAISSLVDSTHSYTAPSTNTFYPAEVFAGVVYLTGSGQTPLKYDSGWSTLTGTTSPDGTAGEFPQATSLASLHGRLWAVLGNSRLHFSDPSDAETWQANDFFELQRTINQIVPIDDRLLIFTNSAIYHLLGDDSTNFGVFPLVHGIGCSDPRSVVSTDKGIMFFEDGAGIVWLYDGAEFHDLSEPVHSDLRSIAASSASMGAVFHEDRYYLSFYPSFATFVLDARTGMWTKYSYDFLEAVSTDEDLYGIGSTLGDGIHDLDDPLNGLGTDEDVNAQVRTALFPVDPNVKHRLHRVTLYLSDLDVNSSFDVELYTDFADPDLGSPKDTITISGDDYSFYTIKDFSKHRWNAAQLQIISNNNERFQLDRIVLQMSSLVSTRDGGESFG